MRFAFAAHRLGWGAVIQALFAVVGTAYGAHSFGLPGIAGPAPLALLIALGGALSITMPIVRAWPSTRTNASRNAGLVTATVVLLLIAPAVVVAGVGTLLGASNGVAYLSVLLWLLAIQLVCGAAVSSTYQGGSSAVYVLLWALIGRIDSVVQPWAWPLAEIDTFTMLLIGGGAFVISLAVLGAFGLHDRRVPASA